MLCRKCNSTWRARAIALAVEQGLGYTPRVFNEIKADWSRIGLGISDDVTVSSIFGSKFFYSNSFFDTYPYLDIRRVPSRAKGQFEFVTCSDVLEHIDKGLDAAFKGLFSLIRKGGFLVASVPVISETEHEEFYEDLVKFEISESGVSWVNSKGKHRLDRNPEFHGGRGQNLAFRHFSNQYLRSKLSLAGFYSIEDVNFDSSLGVPKIELPGIVVARKKP